MKRMILAVAFLILFLGADARSKEWRGIVPLHSMRADVERILGPAADVCKCSYRIQDANVAVVYSSGDCKNGGTGDWNIPPDTVIRFSVYPEVHSRLAALKIDARRFKIEEDPELPGIFVYFDKEDGFGMTVEDGLVRDFFYEPAANDNHLRCPGSRA